MDLQLQGKRVLITGASQGIGKGLANIFAEEGCDLHLVARSGDRLRALASQLENNHGIVVTIQEQDIALPSAAEKISDVAGDIDIVVNNAGAIPGGDLWEVDVEKWHEGWGLKVFGYINLCRLFYAKMKERGHGIILNNIGYGGENFDFNYIAGTNRQCSIDGFYQNTWRTKS